MTNYFKDCQTVEETKVLYRKLAFEHHPDKGGDQEIMKVVNNQYKDHLKSLDGKISLDELGVEHQYHYSEVKEQELVDKIYELIALNMIDVDIVLIGTWLWILGPNTKTYKEDLKTKKCLWHSGRKCWYFKPTGSWAGRSNKDLSELANKYGIVDCEQFKEKKTKSKKSLA